MEQHQQAVSGKRLGNFEAEHDNTSKRQRVDSSEDGEVDSSDDEEVSTTNAQREIKMFKATGQKDSHRQTDDGNFLLFLTPLGHS